MGATGYKWDNYKRCNRSNHSLHWSGCYSLHLAFSDIMDQILGACLGEQNWILLIYRKFSKVWVERGRLRESAIGYYERFNSDFIVALAIYGHSGVGGYGFSWVMRLRMRCVPDMGRKYV